MELEHLIPISMGGGTDKHNVVPACGKCNSDKGAKMPEEFAGKRTVIELMKKLVEFNP